MASTRSESCTPQSTVRNRSHHQERCEHPIPGRTHFIGQSTDRRIRIPVLNHHWSLEVDRNAASNQSTTCGDTLAMASGNEGDSIMMLWIC